MLTRDDIFKLGSGSNTSSPQFSLTRDDIFKLGTQEQTPAPVNQPNILAQNIQNKNPVSFVPIQNTNTQNNEGYFPIDVAKVSPTLPEGTKTPFKTWLEGEKAAISNYIDRLGKSALAQIAFSGNVTDNPGAAIAQGVSGIATGKTQTPSQEAADKGLQDIKANENTLQYKKQQSERQAKIEKGANAVKNYANENTGNAITAAFAGNLLTGTENLTQSMMGNSAIDELYGIGVTKNDGSLQTGSDLAIQDDKGFKSFVEKAAGSLGNMTPSIAVGLVTGPTGGALTTWFQTQVNTLNQDLRSGKDYKNSFVHSLFNATSEAGLQYALGNIPGLSAEGAGTTKMISKIPALQGAKTTIDSAIESLSSKPLLQSAIKIGMKTAGGAFDEGLEEGLQQAFSNVYQKYIFKDGTKVSDGVLESALLGATMSVVLGAGGNIRENIAEQIKQDIKDGNYTPEQKSEALQQFDEIQSSNELDNFNSEYQKIRKQISEDTTMPELDKQAQLNELDNYKEQFVKDGTQNNSEFTQEEESKLIETAKNRFNKSVEFVDTLDGASGLYDNDTGTIKIARDAVGTSNPAMVVFGHELTHSLEGTQSYRALKDYISENSRYLNYVKKNTGNDTWEKLVESKKHQYSKIQPNMSNSQAEYELVSDAISNDLFTDENTIQRLSNDNRGIAQKILNWIRELRIRFFGTEEEKLLSHTESLYRNALSAGGKGGKGIQYSANGIKDENGNFVGVKQGDEIYRIGNEQTQKSLEQPAPGESLSKSPIQQLEDAAKLYGYKIPKYKPMPLPTMMDATGTRVVGNTINTMLHSGIMNNTQEADVADDIVNGKLTYTVSKDNAAESYARDFLNRKGYDNALIHWDNLISENKRITKDDIVLAEIVLQQAIKEQNAPVVRKLIADIATVSTEHGQATQAISMFKKLTGSAQLDVANRQAERLNNMFKDRIDKTKSPQIKVDEALAEKLTMAQSEEERTAISEEIKQDLIRQLPKASWLDKWNAWRMVSMLGNVKTQGRNFLGNALFAPVVITNHFFQSVSQIPANKIELNRINEISNKIKNTTDINNQIELLGKARRESGYVSNLKTALNGIKTEDGKRSFINSEIKALDNRISAQQGIIKTRALKSNKAYDDFVSQDFETMKPVIMSGGKLNPLYDDVLSQRKIFSTKPLEKYRTITLDLLEKGDLFFTSRYYKNALSSFLTANKIDINALKAASESLSNGKPANTDTAQLLEYGRQYAIKEAQEATFRDKSKLAETINNFSNHGTIANLLINGVLPFKKTPINVAKRGVEYSPIGIAKSLAEIKDLHDGNIDTVTFLNDLTKGITGTGIVTLGLALAARGMLTGELPDDENEAKLMQTQGVQGYSIKIGDRYISVDWIAPASLPLFLGVELYNQIKSANGVQLKDIQSMIEHMARPLFNLTMLSGVSDLMTSSKYDNNNSDSLLGMLKTTGENYVGQAVPTVLGQLARTIDSERRTTRTNTAGALNTEEQYALQKVQSKIPGLASKREPYLDVFGNKQKQGNIAERAFNNFLNPAYVSKYNPSDMAQAMIDINKNKTSKSDTVMPYVPDNTLKFNGKSYALTPSQQTELRQMVGQAQQKVAENYTDNANNAQNDSQYDYLANNLKKAMEDVRKAEISKFIGKYKDTLKISGK